MKQKFQIKDWKTGLLVLIGLVIIGVGLTELYKSKNRKELARQHIQTGNIDPQAWKNNQSWFAFSSSLAFDEEGEMEDSSSCEDIERAFNGKMKYYLRTLGYFIDSGMTDTYLEGLLEKYSRELDALQRGWYEAGCLGAGGELAY